MRYDRDRIREVAGHCRTVAANDEDYAPVMTAMADVFDAYAELRPLDSGGVDRLTGALDELVDLTEQSLAEVAKGRHEETTQGVPAAPEQQTS